MKVWVKNNISTSVQCLLIILSAMMIGKIYPNTLSEVGVIKESLVDATKTLEALKNDSSTVVMEEARYEEVMAYNNKLENQIMVYRQGAYVVEEVLDLIKNFKGEVIALEEGELITSEKFQEWEIAAMPYTLQCKGEEKALKDFMKLLGDRPDIELVRVEMVKKEDWCYYMELVFNVYMQIQEEIVLEATEDFPI